MSPDEAPGESVTGAAPRLPPNAPDERGGQVQVEGEGLANGPPEKPDLGGRGELVAVFAEGRITRTGTLLGFRRGLVPEYMKAPILFASVLAVYAGTDWVLHESGLLAVTVMGMTMANARLPSLDELKRYVQAEVKRQTRADFCSEDRPDNACAYLQAPYLQLPKALEHAAIRQTSFS